MNKDFWRLDVSLNPFVNIPDFNGQSYEGYWNDLVSAADSPFKTVLSEEPNPKETATVHGNTGGPIQLISGGEVYMSEPYGGNRPPTW